MTGINGPILIVDDDAEDRLLLKDAFNDLHYSAQIHFEDNGEKAINYLQVCIQQQSIPHLVVLDLNMPRLNGRQTLQWIKNQPELRDIVVIIYSTSLNPIEKEECMRLGAHSYMVKPISYKESIAIAKTLLCFNNHVKQ